MEEVAYPTCAAALADTVVDQSLTCHVNRCLLDAPLQEEQLLTLDNHLFIKGCRLRARTGGVDVDVVASAVPALYFCSTEEELRCNLALSL